MPTPLRDQAARGRRKTSFQRQTPRAAVRHTHPSGRPPVTRTGDEPFRRRPSDQIPSPIQLGAGGLGDPSGSVFSSHVQQQANRTQRSRPQTRLSRLNGATWWSLSGSNRRPPACKAGALPAELKPRCRHTAGTGSRVHRARSVQSKRGGPG